MTYILFNGLHIALFTLRLSTEGCLCCVHAVAPVNSDSENILVHISFCTCGHSSLRYLLRHEIAGLVNVKMVKCKRYT